MVTVHTLHIPHRTDREENMIKQAKEQGFKIEWHIGEYNKKNPKKAINLGHKAIITKAKEAGMNSVLVAEDDCSFFDKGALDYFLSKVPEQYDIFCGLIYVGNVDENNRIISTFSGGMTFYSCHSKFYDKFLALPDDVHIDREIGNHHKDFELYVCNPYVCQQTGGYSDNLRKNMTYQVYLEGKSLFKAD